VIPYAYWDLDAIPVLIRICPVCGERIQEASLKGMRYATHYAEQHATPEEN
jgi:hypothetical protein